MDDILQENFQTHLERVTILRIFSKFSHDVSELIKNRSLQRLECLIKAYVFYSKAFLSSYQRDFRLMSALENLLFRQKKSLGVKSTLDVVIVKIIIL